MKNLSKKIGVGVVASSLVVGGAVSTGLVANANSDFIYIEAPKRVLSLSDKMGDLEIMKSLKNHYGFKVLGYYLESKDKRNKMIEDIKEFSEWSNIKDTEKYEQIKDISDIASNLYNKDNISYEDIQQLQSKFEYFEDARSFLKSLLENGMNAGVKKVQIGDALAIFVLENNISPDKNWNDNWHGKWKKDINELINDKFIEVKSDNLKSDEDKIIVKEEWLGGRLQVKDIEEDDYKEILKDSSM